MTLNSVMAVALRYFTDWSNCVPTHNRVYVWRNLCTSLLYFVVRVRCRRKESSRSLSHLLMSFLSSVLSQCTRLTYGQTDKHDGQTDRIPIVRPRLHSMQRGKMMTSHTGVRDRDNTQRQTGCQKFTAIQSWFAECYGNDSTHVPNSNT